MNQSPRRLPRWRHWLRRLSFWTVCLAGVVVAVGGGWRYLSTDGAETEAFVYYTVQQGDLPIVITERGNLEAQVETTIRCDVENFSNRNGSYGTAIIFIVPNGSAVKKGDLLFELDSAAIRERLDSQTLDHQRATSARVQAQSRHDNQVLQNETAEAEADLKVRLAELDLQMYLDEQDGTYQLALEDIDRQMDDANNLILESRAALELERTEKSGIEELFKLGYRGKSDLDQSRFRFMQAEDRLAATVNRLKTYQSTRRRLENYERKMQELELRGKLETAKRGLVQVRNDNTTKLAQAVAAKVEAESAETKEKERLDKLNEQLQLCKVYAPHDGMAVYARESRSNTTEIAEGAMVRQLQRVLTLPDLSLMQVKTEIHEAVLDQVKKGQAAAVRIDAFPDVVYTGLVESVAVVPTFNYFNSGLKTYEAVVRIQDSVKNLKPGMTAVVEIHSDRLENVLTAPVQAVVQLDGATWCYVEKDQQHERRALTLGRSNDKFVHVQEGLTPGEKIILNPGVIVEQSRAVNEINPERGEPAVPLVKKDGQTSTRDKVAGPAGGQDGAKAASAPKTRDRKKKTADADASAAETDRPQVGGG